VGKKVFFVKSDSIKKMVILSLNLLVYQCLDWYG